MKAIRTYIAAALSLLSTHLALPALAAGLFLLSVPSASAQGYSWGFNGYGGLGNGNNTQANVPVAISTSGAIAGKTITQISAAPGG